MSKVTVTLPSGMQGVVRGLRGKEVNMFANMTHAKANSTTLKVISNVWSETKVPSDIYAFPDDEIDWGKVLLCDRFTTLLYARVATWGPKYEFRIQCGACQRRFDWELDLTELEIKPLPEATKAAYRTENRFSTTVMDDDVVRQVYFQLLTPKLEAKMQQAEKMSTGDRATAAIAQRIISVEGLDEGKGAIKAWLNELTMGALYDLITALDEKDGGVETEIEVACPHCGAEEDVELPLDRREFWSPRRSKHS